MKLFKGVLIVCTLFLFSCAGRGSVKEMDVQGLYAWPGEPVFLGGSDEEIGHVNKVEHGKNGLAVEIEFDPPVRMTFSSVYRDDKSICLVPGMAASKQERKKLILNVAYHGKIPPSAVIPVELLDFIQEDTLFFMAEVSPLGGNQLYILDSDARVSGLYTDNPRNHGFFDGKPEFLFQGNKKEQEGFLAFIKNFSAQQLRSFVNTPVNLEVQGGTVLYVYMKYRNDTRGFRFAPEAPGREEITGAFNKLSAN